MPTAVPTPGQAADTSANSAMPQDITRTVEEAPGENPLKPAASGGGMMEALKNLMQFFSAKAGSASNSNKYGQAMKDAGLEEDETGISK